MNGEWQSDLEANQRNYVVAGQRVGCVTSCGGFRWTACYLPAPGALVAIGTFMFLGSAQTAVENRLKLLNPPAPAAAPEATE